MKYYKTDDDGKIISVVDTTDAEWAEREGYRNDKEVVQVYDGSFKFADETTEDDFKPPLSIVKENKISELKGIRDFKEVEPVQTSKGLFDYDDKSRDRLQIARQSLADNPSVESIVWTTADNQRVAMTITDFAEINSMAAYRSNQLHVKYNELKELVNAAKTVEEVESIQWMENNNGL